MRSVAAGLVVLGVMAGPGLAQSPRPGRSPSPSPTPSPTPSPSPSPGGIVLDVDKQVEEVLAKDAEGGIPRFETSIEVVGKSPQIMLERFFGGIDLECAPGGAPKGGGAPTEVEMREARARTTGILNTPYIDFATIADYLAHKLKPKGRDAERYFIYRVTTNGRVSHVLRAERIPASMLFAVPGTVYELVDAFPDIASAVRGWKRIEHGFASAIGPSSSPPPPWAITTCRPKK